MPLLSTDMKTRVVQHVPRININIWYMSYDIQQNDKQSLLSLHMETKIDNVTDKLLVPSCCQNIWHFLFYFKSPVPLHYSILRNLVCNCPDSSPSRYRPLFPLPTHLELLMADGRPSRAFMWILTGAVMFYTGELGAAVIRTNSALAATIVL